MFHNLKILPIFTTLSFEDALFIHAVMLPTYSHLMRRKMFLSLLVFTSLHFPAFHPPEIVNTLKIYHFSKHLICFINGTVENMCLWHLQNITLHLYLQFTKDYNSFGIQAWRTEYDKTRNLQIHSIIQLFIYVHGWFCMRYDIEVIKVKECKTHNLAHLWTLLFCIPPNDQQRMRPLFAK